MTDSDCSADWIGRTKKRRAAFLAGFQFYVAKSVEFADAKPKGSE